jgi:primosomal protein N' (replication factor Y)
VVLLDTWLALARPDLRADEEAFRRWANAAALVRPPGEGGRVLAVGEPAAPALQALVRWDPAGFAEREIADRREAHLPPASVVATVSGPVEELDGALAALALPPGAEVLGPAPGRDADEHRVVLRVPRAGRSGLSGALRDLQAGRSLRKLPHLRVQVDARDLG